MITFIDEKGTEHSALVAYSVTNAVNGELSVKGTIYTNDKVLHGIDRGWRFRLDDEYYRVTYAKPNDAGRQIEVEFDAVHQFFYDMSKSMVYDTLNGSKPFETYLQAIFSGSGYTYNLETTVGSIRKENFGNKSRLSLFNDIIKTAGLEFSVRGHVVRILKRIGTDLSAIVRKDFNMNELKIEKNINSFVTYQRGLGAWKDDEDHSKGRYESEYESPLAKIYGRIEAEPVVDERYKETGKLLERLKENVDKSYKVSVEIDMEDLSRAGYRLSRPNPGDYIMAINETLGFRQKVRIVSFTSEYDVGGNLISRKVVCNDIGSVQRQANEMSSLTRSVQDVAAENAKAIATATKALVSADGKNTIYFSESKPRDEPVGTLRKGDQLYLKEGEKTNLYFWNGAEWELNPLEMDLVKFRKEYESKTKEINQSMAAQTQQTAQALRSAGANASAIEAAKGAITKLNQDLTSAQKAASDQTALLKSDLANIRNKQGQHETEIGKQVAALNAAKTELAGVKSAQATFEQTTTRKLAELANVADGKASKSELVQTATELSSKIASMQASGRNLFLNSLFKQDIRKTGIWTTSTYTATIDDTNKYLGHNALKIVGQDPAGKDGGNPKITYPAIGQYGKVAPGSMANQDVTISFYAIAEKAGTILRSRLGYIGFRDGNVTLTTEIKRYVIKFPQNWTGLSNETTNEWLFNLNRADTVWIWMPKFEVSDTDTPYSEAPEDVENQISAVESTFKQRADSLEAGVNRLTEGLNTKADSSALTLLSDRILASVKSLETDTDNKLAQKLSTAEFDVRASGIRQEILNATKDKADKTLVTAEAGRLREELASLSVGGRNYFLNSGIKITSGYKEIQVHPDFVKHAKGKKFVISVQVSGENVVAQNRGRFGLSTSAGIVESTNRAWSEVWETGTGNISKKRIYKVFEFRDDWIDFIAGLYIQTGSGAVAGYPKLEISTVPSDWSPAPEDTEGQITEAKAVFERTVEGRFATISQQIADKANQTDFQRVQETSKLYERLIGSTEKEVIDKVSRMALTNELFQVEVSKNLGLRTVQYQIANAWAVQNLNSNGDIISQINMTGPNVRIQGESIHLDGKALIDNGIIKNAMIESMLADKITAGTLNAANVNIINLNASKIVGLDANFIKSKIELAFIEWMKGKTISAQNNAMQIDLNNGQINYYTDRAAMRRVLTGYPTQFVKFETGVVVGKGLAGVTVIGSNRGGNEDANNGGFVGIRAWNGPDVDQIDVVGDLVRLTSSPYTSPDGWNVITLPNKLGIDAYNASDRPSSLLSIGDVRLYQNAKTYTSLKNILNQFNTNFKHLVNITGRGDVIRTWDSI